VRHANANDKDISTIGSVSARIRIDFAIRSIDVARKMIESLLMTDMMVEQTVKQVKQYGKHHPKESLHDPSYE
jgi:hypothetical protein